MSYNARLNILSLPTATGATLAAAATVDGSWCDLTQAQPGAEVNCRITTIVKTSSVVFTPKIQVSNDQSNVYDFATCTASAAGTGSVVTTNQVWRSYGAIPWKYARVRITCSGATSAGADDQYAFTWSYLRDTING